MTPASFLDFKAHAADYARYHAHPKNRACHAIGIPLIMLAVIRWTQLPSFPLVPCVAIVLPLYAVWDFKLALLMAGVVLALALVALHLSPALAWAAFILGWIFQFIGHAVFEKKSPAFARNLIHVLVGPLWILREMSGGVGCRRGARFRGCFETMRRARQ
ncbi:MAG: Mpo1-like protein [Elusimicrobiota bacterium]